MKKLLTSLLLVTLLNVSYANNSVLYKPKYQIKYQNYGLYKNDPIIPLGLGMIIGGATLMTAGLLTQPVRGGLNEMTPRPLIKQGPRGLVIFGGIVFLSVGIIISF
jgi:hypothetical protein